MKCPYVIRKCKKCGRLLVACSINFTKNKTYKWGIETVCKECKKIYREKNKERINASKKKWRDNNKEHIKEYVKNNKEHISEYMKEYNKEYAEKNKERIKEYKKNYMKEYNKEYKKQWCLTPTGQASKFNSRTKRRIKEESQGSGINKHQWKEMMEFFNWECAYSGIKLNKDVRSIDHIIPLDKNGENEVWNLVPMYKPYNSSKHNKDMLEWYQSQDFYSEEKLQKIYEWQEYAYNKWGK